jgi:hypothetical protein
MNNALFFNTNFANTMNNVNFDDELMRAILENWTGTMESLSDEDLSGIVSGVGRTTMAGAGSCYTMGNGPRC